MFIIKEWKKKNIIVLVLTLAFITGFSGLVLQLVWSRYLNLLFGLSVFAVSVVLASFMLGLSFGNWFIGRISDKTNNHFKLLSIILGVLGIYCFLFHLIFMLLYNNLNDIFAFVAPSSDIKNIIRFLLSFVVLLPPTTLLGGVFPVLLKIYTNNITEIGKNSGLISFISTVGGVIGSFLTGFILIKTLGHKNTIFIIGTLNILSAVFVFYLSRYYISLKETSKITTKKESIEYTSHIVYITLIAFFISGFTALSYELIWTKILTFFIRDSIYDFSIVLTTFLIGLAFGNFIGGKVFGKRGNPVFIFAFVQISIGIFAILSLYLFGKFPYIINNLASLSRFYDRYQENYFLYATAVKFGYSFLLMFIPASLFGITLPVAIRICSHKLENLGKDVGFISAIESLGSTIGPIVTGFLLIGLLGFQNSTILLCFMNVSVGIALIIVYRFKKPIRKVYTILSVIIIMVVLFIFLPGWDKVIMSKPIKTEFLSEAHSRITLLMYEENKNGITSVLKDDIENVKYLVTNRLYSQNTSIMGGLQDHRRLGYIPSLLHNSPDSALVIGLGAGITLDGVQDTGIKNIDCVEISESVIEAAKFFSEENNDIINNPDINFIVDDGRNFVSTTNKKYDVIIGDILHPMSSGTGSLLTKEYFDLTRERLNIGGIFCQWLPLHQHTLTEIKIISNTFRQAYPQSSLWYGMIGTSVPVVGLIGSNDKIVVNLDSLKKRYKDQKLINNLRSVILDDPSYLLSNIIIDNEHLDDFCKSFPINTDDKPIIEFSAPQMYKNSSEQGIMNLVWLNDFLMDNHPHIRIDSDKENLYLIKEYISMNITAKMIVVDGYLDLLEGNRELQIQHYEMGLAKYPHSSDLAYSLYKARREYNYIEPPAQP